MKREQHNADDLLDFSAAAVDADCHFTTIDRAARAGELPFSWHPGRRKRLVSRADLEVWKSRRGGGPAPDPTGDAIISLATAVENALRGDV